MAEIIEREPSVGMTWEEVCSDPILQDLPYKIDLNEWGQIVMSPTGNRHGALQGEIAAVLRELWSRRGRVVIECAIRTSGGTKVADLGWFSAERRERVKDEFDSSIAPEICVEIRSPRNSTAEREMKRALYLQAGAVEVWICNENGEMSFYDATEKRVRSTLLPDFPTLLEI